MITINYCAEDDFVWVKVKGIFQQDESTSLLEAIIAELKRHSSRGCLIDYTEGQFKGETIRIYERVKKMDELGFPQQTMLAAVFPTMSEEIRFFQTVLINRGYIVRHFSNLDEAMIWIKKKS